MNKMKNFFSKYKLGKLLFCLLFIIHYSLFIPLAAHAADTNVPAGEESAFFTPDIGDDGLWATENNQKVFLENLSSDVDSFQSEFQKKLLVKDYVPIEAKVGRAFIGAMSMIGEVLDRSLFSFIRIFMLILFAFWVGLEAYNLIQTGGDAKKLVEDIVKKSIWLTIWLLILSNNPAQIFMWFMSPILAMGTYLSDVILNAVAAAAGTSLPDTCNAIHGYMAQNPIGENVISSAAAADMLCVPTRLSGFFYTAVAAGFKWVWAGIGHSMMTFIAGIVFVVIFVYNIWNFALQALGVIASMFIAVLLLPFTAIAETFVKWKPSDNKSQLSKIFESFVKLFAGPQSLQDVIRVFVKALFYFIVLSVIAAIGMAILGEVATTDLASDVPTIESDSFMVVLICGALVAYLADQAEKIAKDFDATIDGDFGKKVGNDVKTVWKNTVKQVKEWRKVLKKKS